MILTSVSGMAMPTVVTRFSSGSSTGDSVMMAVFVAHSTAAIALIEYEQGGVEDLRELMERLVPADAGYHHNRTAGDTNAHAHLRAAVIGPSETVPLKGGRLQTGTWQQFVLLDFDDQPRERTVMVQVIGMNPDFA